MAKKKTFYYFSKTASDFLQKARLQFPSFLLTISETNQLGALLKPFQYSQDVAKRFAISSLIACWILAIFLSVLPTFINGFFLSIHT